MSGFWLTVEQQARDPRLARVVAATVLADKLAIAHVIVEDSYAELTTLKTKVVAAETAYTTSLARVKQLQTELDSLFAESTLP